MTHLIDNPFLTFNAINDLVTMSSAKLIVPTCMEKSATVLLESLIDKFHISIEERKLTREEAITKGFIKFTVVPVMEWTFSYPGMWILVTPNETYYSEGR